MKKKAIKRNSKVSNIRQALLKLGLAPMGANYIRAKNLLENIHG